MTIQNVYQIVIHESIIHGNSYSVVYVPLRFTLGVHMHRIMFTHTCEGKMNGYIVDEKPKFRGLILRVKN